jgi:FAD:protein FMN transferase
LKVRELYLGRCWHTTTIHDFKKSGVIHDALLPNRYLVSVTLGVRTLTVSSAFHTARTVRRVPFRRQFEAVLGTRLELQFVARSHRDAQCAESAALERIDALGRVFNRFDQHSELNALMRSPGVGRRVSSELLEVLRAADLWQLRSNGAFHAGADAFGGLWREAAQTGVLPARSRLARLALELKQPLWEINDAQQSATWRCAHSANLNAIAKGFIAEQACQAAWQAVPLSEALVNLGGDLAVRGAQGAVIEVASGRVDNAPVCRVRLRDASLATSGGAWRGFEVAGQRFSHLIDPRSGWPVSRFASVSVVAPDGSSADALATALSVLPADQGLTLADQFEGVGCLIVTASGQQLRNGVWKRLEADA